MLWDFQRLSQVAQGSPPKADPLVRPVRLMSAEKDARLRAQLPRVDDPQVQAMLEDPSLILYTEAEIPTAYQDWSSGLQGIHSPSYNVSANGREPYGNGNVEFPWRARWNASGSQRYDISLPVASARR